MGSILIGPVTVNGNSPSNLTGEIDVDAATTESNIFTGTQIFKGIVETQVSMGSSSIIDLSQGTYFTRTAVEAEITLSVINIPANGKVGAFILDLDNFGTVINWWDNIEWSNGSAPIPTEIGRDLYGFLTYDEGVTWSGIVLGVKFSHA